MVGGRERGRKGEEGGGRERGRGAREGSEGREGGREGGRGGREGGREGREGREGWREREGGQDREGTEGGREGRRGGERGGPTVVSKKKWGVQRDRQRKLQLYIVGQTSWNNPLIVVHRYHTINHTVNLRWTYKRKIITGFDGHVGINCLYEYFSYSIYTVSLVKLKLSQYPAIHTNYMLHRHTLTAGNVNIAFSERSEGGGRERGSM